ncbi:precorrin-2 C(20)-methyltransferase [Tepidibacillus fermentans]|uniref:Precorrin-2/cobalt-factor-2 C20-methyltransferase n=1 Tax=Tepidibacillus fermentans TaxID=1281767 RepID=A0A4R3KB78_9BACI|nr:precorrin-2 C(20)-methyltransferase [Tepidibacillus fermentans]TCS79921.1 precorrin-2/cobalt-factor-2 C20-methyltransferase [Tepidibacillus fermentans]
MEEHKIGQFFGIGLGPGDPELLTLKALRVIKNSPVIAFPIKAVNEASYALSIVSDFIDMERQQLLPLLFPMTKNKEIIKQQWKEATEAVFRYLQQGKDVAFLTEGDPLFYSTFIHLRQYMGLLHPEVAVQSIPGISSIFGAAASLHLPLADGDAQVGIIPATRNKDHMKKAIEQHETIIFLKIAKVLDLLVDVLIETNTLEKAAIVTKATSNEEIIYKNVLDLKGKELPYLSLMVVKRT